MVTRERLKELYHYNKKTGVFTRRSNGKVSIQKKRVRIRIDGKLYIASRLAWLYVTGKWPENEIDHRDRDPMNNRWKNLRDLTHEANLQNNGGKGYTKKGRKWQVQRSHKYIGLFNTKEEAAIAATR